MVLSAAYALLSSCSSPVTVREEKVSGIRTRVVTLDLDDPTVSLGVVTAQGFPGTDERFGSMVSRSDFAIAINGAYFDKQTLKPIGDIVVNGNLVHSGRMGTAFSVSMDNELDIVRVTRHKTMKWEDKRLVLACGPALVLDGKIDVDWKFEGFRDPHVTGRAPRMGIGYTSDHKLKFMQVLQPVTFEQFGEIAAKLGCYEAMNLDAGASTGLYALGKTYAQPGRKLTNIFGAWVSKSGGKR